MKRHGQPQVLVTEKPRSYGAAMKVVGNALRKKLVAGSTIGPRIHTSHSDEESGSCFDLGACEPYRYSSPSTPQSTTISTRNDISTAGPISSSTEPPHLPSGVSWAPPETCAFKNTETGSHSSDSPPQPETKGHRAEVTEVDDNLFLKGTI